MSSTGAHVRDPVEGARELVGDLSPNATEGALKARALGMSMGVTFVFWHPSLRNEDSERELEAKGIMPLQTPPAQTSQNALKGLSKAFQRPFFMAFHRCS